MRKRMWALLGASVVTGMMAVNCSAQGLLEPQGANPANKQEEVKTIFSFKKEVGLTDDQENKIKALLYDEQAALNQDTNAVKALAADLGKLVDAKAEMPAIKSKLEEISKIQVTISCRNIEDSRQVEAILSPEQLKKWKEIQKDFGAQTK